MCMDRIIEIEISGIRITDRSRKDMGDIASLAESIKTLGLLHPIGITPDNVLLFGERRLRAYEALGRSTIPARVIDVPILTIVEHAENEVRKEFTYSDRVAIGKAIEAELGNRRGSNQYHVKGELVGNCPHAEDGEKSRDIAAAKAGFTSTDSYRRAKTVTEHGTPELVEAMDNGDVAVSTAATLATAPIALQQQAIADPKQAVALARQISKTRIQEARQLTKDVRAVSTTNGDDDTQPSAARGNDEWYTPEEYIAAARRVMGGLDLDPASCNLANQTVQADRYFTIENSGLDADWYGEIWLNPPYSMPLIEQFIETAIEEYRAGRIEQAIILTNNATDTGWLHTILKESAIACITRGRIRFSSPKNDGLSPRQGQVFFYLGNRIEQFGQKFARYGTIVHTGAGND